MRILYFTPSIGNGGVEKMMHQWMTKLSTKGYEFDIVTNEVTSERYYSIFSDLANNIYEMKYHQLRLDKKIPVLWKIMKQRNYDAFHVHSCFSFDFWMMIVAAIKGIKIRIIHSHNSHVVFRLKVTEILDRISKPLLRVLSTDYLACSVEAGISLLGDTPNVRQKLIIIENGIDIPLYIPNEIIRKTVREELHIGNKKVLGSVGRLDKQKNYSYLLDVFKCIVSRDNDAVLVLIGSGEEEHQLKKKATELGIDDYVMFLGERNDVPRILLAMDVFALTSLFEGLGVSMIEAQCSGLPCIGSTNIPNEVDLTKRVRFLDLDDSPQLWADCVLELFRMKRSNDAYLRVANAGYDINASADKLDNFYGRKLALLKENKGEK